ncbi:MAG: NADH-quinone oxidoreductase subunit D [Armatimonadota bacterium]
MSELVESAVRQNFPDAVLESDAANGELVLKIAPESLVAISQFLKDQPELSFDYPASITGVDWNDRMEMLYHLTSLSTGKKVVLKTDLDHENPEVESVVPVWKGADWQEREVYDLLGVRFTGHPNLKRILLPEGWEGYPLRKDYVIPEDDRHFLPKDWSELGEDDPKAEEPVCYKTPGGELVCDEPGRLRTEEIQLSMGPQHPSTHGVLRLEVVLDGEIVVDCRPDVGYLHRGIEKLAEMRTYIQFIPITDRLDYLSSMLNNAAYVQAIEKLGGIEVPERAEYVRVIMMELQRIASHLVFFGTFGLDLGATTPFLYAFREREDILNLFEMVCGARLTYNYFRPGGVSRDLPAGFEAKCREYIQKQRKMLAEYDTLLTENEIFLIRTRNVGPISAKDAIDYGLSGPTLRGSGVAYDVRRSEPYSIYDRFDFEVATCPEGDCLARYNVRMKEIRESLKIIEQALDGLPKGKLEYKLPPVFKLPEGEVYHHIESSRGDLGVYLVSDGSPKPYRLKLRAPSFINLQALPQMVRGWKVADVIATLGTIDIILGEVDR